MSDRLHTHILTYSLYLRGTTGITVQSVHSLHYLGILGCLAAGHRIVHSYPYKVFLILYEVYVDCEDPRGWEAKRGKLEWGSGVGCGLEQVGEKILMVGHFLVRIKGWVLIVLSYIRLVSSCLVLCRKLNPIVCYSV